MRADIARETISKFTGAVAGELAEWQSRLLDRVHAVVMIDCIWVEIGAR
ncbi:transposase [Nocardia gipuzkoensis]